VPNRSPRLKGDSQNDRGYRQRDQRVAGVKAERHDACTQHHSEADKGIDTRMVTVCDKSGAVQSAARPRSDVGSHEVASEAHQARQGERDQVARLVGIDEAFHGLIARHASRHEDHGDDRKPRVTLRSLRAQHEGDTEWQSRERVAHVVYQVSEKGNAAAQDEDHGLDGGRNAQDSERFCYGADAFARPFDGRIYKAVGMVVQGTTAYAGARGVSKAGNRKGATPDSAVSLPDAFGDV
jgi:hypothetical protein